VAPRRRRVREKALWRLLYETAARISEALSINVEDLELDNKRVRGALQGRRPRLALLPDRLARLLPRLIAEHTRGPLFLADCALVPARTPATVDHCPDTGRARLATAAPRRCSGKFPAGGRCISLRHSALTHLAEQNVSLSLLSQGQSNGVMPICVRAAQALRTPTPSTPAVDRDVHGLLACRW
jgi:integrase